jgi:hypothetical protein
MKSGKRRGCLILHRAHLFRTHKCNRELAIELTSEPLVLRQAPHSRPALQEMTPPTNRRQPSCDA